MLLLGTVQVFEFSFGVTLGEALGERAQRHFPVEEPLA